MVGIAACGLGLMLAVAAGNAAGAKVGAVFGSAFPPPDGTIVKMVEGHIYRHRIRVESNEFDAETIEMAIARISGVRDVMRMYPDLLVFDFHMPPNKGTVTIGKVETIKSPSGRDIPVKVVNVWDMGLAKDYRGPAF